MNPSTLSLIVGLVVLQLEVCSTTQYEIEVVQSSCKLSTLELNQLESIVDCIPQPRDDTADEGTTCVLSIDLDDANQLALKKCIHGRWTDSDLGNRLSVQKRFWGIVAAVVIGGAVACYYLCPRDVQVQVVKLTPPTFNPCKPAEIKERYDVESGQTSTAVSWSEPVAQASDGSAVSVVNTGSYRSGNQFPGSVAGRQYLVTYTATDKNGLVSHCQFSFEVYIKTCSEATPPLDGKRSCGANANLGSMCYYECNNGFQLQGDSNITCQGSSSPSWSSTIPTCEKVDCGDAPTIENGDVTCSSTDAGSVCSITCNDNYMRVGESVIICQSDGSWTPIASTECTDRRPPDISCKTPQTFYADRGKNSTIVEWALPTATDIIDPNPSLIKIDGPDLATEFEVGSTFITYKATDDDGNESGNCTIEIRVEESTCPHPYDILQDTTIVYECDTTSYVYGTECELSCEFHYSLNGTNLITCEVEDPDNPTAVGTWSWGNGTMPHCNRIDCPPLDPPVNGAIVLGYVLTNAIYTMQCQENYTIPGVVPGLTGQWICQNSGTYTPPIDVPDCTRPRTPRSVSLPAEIFYYSGDCSDPATVQQIKANVLQILTDSVDPVIKTICPEANNCLTGNLQVTCGDITYRKRRSTRTPRRAGKSFPHIKPRDKRQLQPPMIIEFDIITFIVFGDGQAFFDALDETDRLQSDVLVPYFQAAVANGTFDVNGFTLESDSFKTPNLGDVDCDIGYKFNQENCEPCPPGYFLNSSNECELCELGTYADIEGLTSCIACPTGFTTIKTGTKDLLLCKELCPVGKYSADGLVPCTSCPVGYYQGDIGQTSCIRCDTGTTEFSGSTDSTQCHAFHMLVDDTSGVVTAGTFSTSLSDITIMFWTKLFAELNASASIRLTSAGNEILIFYLTGTNKIQVQVPGTNFDLEIDYPFSHVWTHVAVTWDTTNSELSVYFKGNLHHSDNTITSPFSPLITNGTVEVESSGDTGIYIADFHVEDAILSASEVKSMTTNCWIERPNDIFNMSNFRDTAVRGINIQTPTFCDPIDECDTNPCNNDVISHTCEDGINTYKCHCIEGYTGQNCETPTDYCIGNLCENNSTCSSGNGTYACSCLTGYTGGQCEIAPVNGGWSEWSEWTDCTVTCNGGTQTRTRSCDSPEPTPYGANCTGDRSEIQSCNQNTCPICPELTRGFGMVPNCTTDDFGTSICEVRCKKGTVIPDSLKTNVFECGSLTNYTWSPMSNAPDCVDPTKGSRSDLRTSVQTNDAIPQSNQQAAEQAITQNLANQIPCVGNATCQVTGVEITTARRKRSSGSTITVTLSVIMTETGDLEIQNYIDTSYVSPSFQELINAVYDLETAAAIINSSSNSIFDVTVNGITYTTDSSTLTITGNVTCPTGQVATEGVCAACPAGTYYIDGYCTFCDVGTYTSNAGQTSCAVCPSGLTTTTLGSFAASQCSETLTTPVESSTTTTRQDTEESDDNHALYIGIGLAAIALAISLFVGGFVFYKKKCIKPRERIGSQSILQTPEPPLIRDDTSLSASNVNVGYMFPNPLYKEGLGGIQHSSPPPAYCDIFQDNDHPTKR